MKYRKLIPITVIASAIFLGASPANANVMIPVIITGWLGMIPGAHPDHPYRVGYSCKSWCGCRGSFARHVDRQSGLNTRWYTRFCSVRNRSCCVDRGGDISGFVGFKLPLEASRWRYGIADSLPAAFMVDRISDRDMDCERFVSASRGLCRFNGQPGDLFDLGRAGRWVSDLGCLEYMARG